MSAVCATKTGCFIGSVFVGILAYPDVIALLASTAHAMRRMMSVCEEYAAEFCVSFNASKSKCAICMSRRMPKERNFVRDVQFSINGSAVEVLHSRPHLGHTTHVRSRSEDRRAWPGWR